MTKEQLQSRLREGKVDFSFKKVSGDIRKMSATLNESLIPQESVPPGTTGKTEVKENPAVIRCFDLDVNQWRSFRVDSLIEFDGVKLDE